jgi:hypothetical protein
MKNSKMIVAGLVVGLGLIGSLPAMAATYVWTFTDTGSTVVANGQLTTNAPKNANGEVTGITGSVFGSAITGLIDNPIKPNTATSPDGLWFYDNNLQFPAPYVTNPGLLFTVAAPNLAYNLFSDSASKYELYADVDHTYGVDTIGTFSVTAVPEPAVWAMLFLGFGAIGWVIRGNKRDQTAAAVA